MSSVDYPGQALVEAAASLWADSRHVMAFLWAQCRRGTGLLWGKFRSLCAAHPPPTGESAEEERRRLIKERAFELSNEPGNDRQSQEKHWLLAEKRVDESLKARDQRLKDLGDAANTSVNHVNASFLTFMFVWTFVALAIGGSTHEHLLRVSPVDMPLVGIKLPIVAFFAVAPYFVLLLHLNLLLQLYLLSRRLHALDAELDQVTVSAIRHLHRLKLFPLPFSHVLVGREPRPCIRGMVWLFVFVTVVLMPLILLAAAEVRFLPYHSETVAWIQRIAVIADAGFLLLFWPLFRRRDGGPSDSQQTTQSHDGTLISAVAAAVWLSLRRGLFKVIFILLILIFPLFSCFIAVWPGELVEVTLGSWAPSLLTVTPRSIDRQCKTIPDSDISRNPLFHWYPESVPRYLYATCWLFDREGAWGKRNLSLPEATLLAEQPDASTFAKLSAKDSKGKKDVLKNVAGLSLVERDLSFANFKRAVLSKADLRGANLRGADLRGANLSGARLRGANLRGADLQGANLSDARLRGANLRRVDLRGANLPDALLEGANLCGAQLWGANLQGANFQCANLSLAQLQSANLSEAQLQRADLSNAGLQGANIRNAEVSGAGLGGSDWYLADPRDQIPNPLTDQEGVEWGLRESECEVLLKRIFDQPPDQLEKCNFQEKAKDSSEGRSNLTQHFVCLLNPQNNEDNRGKYLGQLGCADSYIRLGLLRQLHQLACAKNASPENAPSRCTSDAELEHQFGKFLHKELLKNGCPAGGETLPKLLQDEERELELALKKWIDE